MKINYISKNYKVTSHFKDIIEKKIAKLEKYFNKNFDVKVNCIEQNDQHKLEVSINADGMFFRSEVVSDNMFNNIDLALPKIERQIVKLCTKNKTKVLKDFVDTLEFLDVIPEEKPKKVVKTKRFELEPMTVEDAEFNLDMLGHSFFVFLNAKSGEVNIIYRRADGDLGLIELEY